MPARQSPPPTPLPSAQVFVSRLPDERLQWLAADRAGEMEEDRAFATPVPRFEFSRNQPLICLVADRRGILRFLARGHRGYSAGTGLSQIQFSHSQPLPSGISLSRIARRLPEKHRRHAEAPLQTGGVISPAASQAVIQEMFRLVSGTREFLATAFAAPVDPFRAFTERNRFRLQQEKDSTMMALEIAGMREEHQCSIDGGAIQANEPFLSKLRPAHMREDPMIRQDFSVLPGFRSIASGPFTTRHFDTDRTSLTIIFAHREALESVTGADLIYYNETLRAFVMVQYKAMEGDSESAEYRLPNADLDREIGNMQRLLEDLRRVPEPVPPSSIPGDFRFSTNPFFLKFCPRTLESLEPLELIPGYYFPLEYWQTLSRSPVLDGPRGGRFLSQENAGRYLSNTEFASLVRKGWIGTRPVESAQLERLIEQSLSTGKAVTIAVANNRSDDPTERRRT